MKAGLTIPTRRAYATPAPGLRAAHWLTVVILPLLALAAGAGLLAPAVYGRNPATIVPALRGQDLVTLLAAPALAAALAGAWRGSQRATLIWLGVLGYMGYTYAGAAVGYAFAELTLLYIALFSLTIYALVAAASALDTTAIAEAFDETTPRRAVAAFLTMIGLLLAALWLGQIGAFLVSGALPAGVVAAGGGPYYVYAFDLGLILPLAALGAVWLWRRRPADRTSSSPAAPAPSWSL
jgi:hypothetical protein